MHTYINQTNLYRVSQFASSTQIDLRRTVIDFACANITVGSLLAKRMIAHGTTTMGMQVCEIEGNPLHCSIHLV